MRGLRNTVKSLLSKARDSALSAVETYNRPNATFRTGTFVVLMVIAWTALFHAIYLQRRVKPYYRKKRSRAFERIDGDFKAWELSECLSQFYGGKTTPVRSNLEFFVGLRNKIEHRSYPQLDNDVFGECQAMLSNFEELLCETFGDEYSLQTGLAFALQFSHHMQSSQSAALSKSMQKSYRSVKQYVETFRSSLSQDVQNDMSYSFKVFLVPKIGNHRGSSDLAIEFVKYDPNNPEEMRRHEQAVALIKPKEVSVINLGLMKPTEVIKQVTKRLGKKFTMHLHVKCTRHFNVRPLAKSPEPAACDNRYCHFDALHRDYGYTSAWVDFLVQKLSEQQTYEFILQSRKSSVSIPDSVAAQVPSTLVAAQKT